MAKTDPIDFEVKRLNLVNKISDRIYPPPIAIALYSIINKFKYDCFLIYFTNYLNSNNLS